jgi:hypothetical protein
MILSVHHDSCYWGCPRPLSLVEGGFGGKYVPRSAQFQELFPRHTNFFASLYQDENDLISNFLESFVFTFDIISICFHAQRLPFLCLILFLPFCL